MQYIYGNIREKLPRIPRPSAGLVFAWILVGLAPLLGCSTIADFVNSRGLKDDLRGLAARHDVALAPSDCRMLPESRTGLCRTNLTERQFDQLRRGWKLSGGSDSPGKTRQDLPAQACLASEEFRDRADLQIAVSPRRPAELPGFEYIAVVRDPDGGRTCVEASYAYG